VDNLKAHALWLVNKGQADVLEMPVRQEPDGLIIKTLYSGISRGTERLVFEGRVPRNEHETMRAPFQEGDFSFPLKYGYSSVGTCLQGALEGKTVFALFPHQTLFALPVDAAILVPNSIPPERAILTANMETALNIVWDAGVLPGDKVAVIGAGVIGALTAYLSAKILGTEVTLIDIDPSKASIAQAFNCQFKSPEALDESFDVVIHASATSQGLATGMKIAGIEAKIVEASWYGDRETPVRLGAAFHQKRLQIRSSQVGRLPLDKTARWTFRRRLEKAISLLKDPVLDHLISGESSFETIAHDYSKILNAKDTLCHRIRY